MEELRKFTRLFAIPLLIIWWILEKLQLFIVFFVSICDLNLDEFDFDFCIEELYGLLCDYIKDGTDGI